MPTEAQLKTESWYNAEFAPSELVRLAKQLAMHYRVPMANFGMKGDEHHLSGYHRSRNWVRRSRFCEDRNYSVSRTNGDYVGGDSDYVSALDIQVPQHELILMCKRLDKAVRAGHLEKVTEWYGTFGNDDRVDGYDNISNRVASSDRSHLWHLHISFDRGHVAKDHADLFAILTGGSTVTPQEEKTHAGHQLAIAHRTMTVLANAEKAQFRIAGEDEDRVETNGLKQQLDRIEAKLNAIGDPATLANGIAAAIINDPNTLAAFLDAIRDEIRRTIDPTLFAETFLSTLKNKL